ncbi:CPBP family intramembrane glutamic endopeptidase [Paenibacillus lutimineralis]|uniref:CPBP family intramembrane metalloprotease n=1 Tax=Paenibacillus lutimineralis TaxID=2707005 RepID=A0A3Q9IBI4_9BACL|nr:type II CAAX endopeptidase family protein [Paenibacillus lutimineralis]AZS17144.1 CPBP family intramembrane metalloprotease [Paenibacillus lutimineralis]
MQTSKNSPGILLKPKALWILAAIGLVLFIVLQLWLPSVNEPEQQLSKTISKDQARQAAASFAQTELGINGNFQNAHVTYDTKPELFGYLTKENLVGKYSKSYGKQFPYDVFHVTFTDPDDILSLLSIDINMQEGNVVAFEKVISTSNATKQTLLDYGRENTLSLVAREGDISLTDKEQLVRPYLKTLGVSEADLKLATTEGQYGLLYELPNYEIGQSQAQIQFHFEYGAVASMETKFTVPSSYNDYLSGQKTLAYILTFAGYGLLTFVLAILAIVYSIVTRAYTSFKRGLLLASLYFVLSMVGAINMLPYLQKDSLSSSILILSFVIQGVVTLLLSGSIYVSLVGGDALWRQKGRILWPRAKEPGYGRHVLTAMTNGYAWALILLGVQSVIFLALENTIHTWSTTDASQSTYNMLLPLLFPLLAWVAGIGEEAVYRLFGIAMLKKMFRSTFVASLITSLIWAFGHTLYPIYPVISRPIELMFIGLLFSFVFLRYGFITAVFSHVIFDTILMSISLMVMGGGLNIAAGLFYLVLPAIVGYLIYRFNPAYKERPISPTKKEEPFIPAPHPEANQ